MDNDPIHSAEATHALLKAKNWNILQWPTELPDLNPIEYAFHFLKTKLRAESLTNKQHLKVADVNTWQSISRQETEHLMSMMMSMGSRLQAVIDLK